MLPSHLFVVFGATGDLMQRKLMPALYDMLLQDAASGSYAVLGVSRSDLSDDDFRQRSKEALVEFGGLDQGEADAWCSHCLHFQSLGDQETEDYQRLADRIEQLEKQHDLPGNRVFYLALPPSVFDDTIVKLGEVDLNTPKNGDAWTRVVFEKPFGRDLDSARELNDLVHRYYAEEQVYRIDHFLGKETVKNLLVFRFGNAIFEPLWNRKHVERVDILVPETLGVGERAGYYDRSGALRDMIQNHLSQIFTLVAMEPPATTGPDDLRFEKVKVLESVQPIQEEDVVFGQYTAGRIDGEAVPGYQDADGVANDSTTETYAAVRLYIANWRWQGVPFVLQTGKRMPRRLTRVSVTFRRPPVRLFQSANSCNLTSNVLHITMQPDEGFALNFEVKVPEQGFRVETHQLQFDYAEAFGQMPDAYRTLLEDVVEGDPTLFVHAREVEESWKIYTPVLEMDLPVHPYAAGTWGPKESDRLLENAPIHA